MFTYFTKLLLLDDSEFRVVVSCSNPVDARVINNRQGAPHGMSGWRLSRASRSRLLALLSADFGILLLNLMRPLIR